MAFSIKPGLQEVDVAVGVISKTVLDAVNFKGFTYLVIVLENRSLTETFSGVTSTSPNGQTQWTDELSDEFVSIPPLTTRRMVLPADRFWARVTGNFGAAPGTIRLTTNKLAALSFRVS